MNSKAILLLCDSFERFLFMKRLTLLDYKFVFITTEPVVYLFSKLNGYDVLLIRAGKEGQTFDSEVIEKSKLCIEYLNSYLTLDEVCSDFTSGLRYLDLKLQNYNIEKIVIWNGQQFLGRLLTTFAEKNKINCRYLELANLPNKIFADDLGVNALSSIAQKPQQLDALPTIEESEHQDWLSHYIKDKESPLPQANKKLKIKVIGLLNRSIKILGFGAGRRYLKLAEISQRNSVESFDDIDLLRSEYIFLPLQVSDDTQIKLHSDYNNLDAIKLAIKARNDENKKLVIKIHPAEKNTAHISEIISLCKDNNVSISNQNTIELIRNSSSVITINSTVGLEALLFGKKVTALGRCFYQNFDQDRLRKYIHYFLIGQVNYFNDDLLKEKSILQLLGLEYDF